MRSHEWTAVASSVLLRAPVRWECSVCGVRGVSSPGPPEYGDDTLDDCSALTDNAIVFEVVNS